MNQNLENIPIITFLNHASFIIQKKNIKILNDPWLFGSAFNNGWNLIKEIDHKNILKGLTHIYFSHEHPDHFSIPFLKSISEEKRNSITIIYQETYDKRVKIFCEKLGYKFQEIKNLKEFKISNDFYIKIGKVPFIDSWINYRVNDKNILNVNDCLLENPDIIFSLKKNIKNIDILFTQFSYAIYIPENDQKNEALNCLKKIKLQDKILKPSFIVPFASFIYFSHLENSFMNNNINTIKAAKNYIEDNCSAYPIILKPNETWKLEKKDNKESLNFWDELYGNIHNLKLNENKLFLDSESLQKKSKIYIERVFKKNNKLIIYILFKIKFFNNINFFVTDLNKSFTFNFFDGLIENSNVSKDDSIQISSESLQYLFEYDYGFETLLLNARFKALPINIKKMKKNFMIGSLNNTGRYIRFSNFHKFLDKFLIERAIKLFQKY